MVLCSYVEQCKKCDYIGGGGGGDFIMFVMMGNQMAHYQKKIHQNICALRYININ